MKRERCQISSFLWADYDLRVPERVDASSPRRLFVLLHGYEQSGEKMMNKLKGVIPASDAVLAPNAPFPLPKRTDDGYRLGFSWYFYNPHTDTYFMDMRPAVDFVSKLIAQVSETQGWPELPVTLIGFSQGGYLAPILASKLKCVDHVIGLGARYLVDEMSFPIGFRADAVHGALDEIVPLKDALESHELLRHKGASGEFRILAGTGHRLDAEMQRQVGELIQLKTP